MDEDTLCCSVCLDLFLDPRNLDCGHTFCFKCICGLHSGDHIACPLCLVPSQKAPGTFPKSYVLSDLVTILQSSKKLETLSSPLPPSDFTPTASAPCTFCEMATALYCTACQQFICVSCSPQHQEFPLTKNHPPLQQVSAAANETCPAHHAAMERYCQDCYVQMCPQCVGHNTHRVVSITVAVQERQDFLRKRFALERREENLAQVQTKLEQLEARANEEESLIQDLKNNLKEAKVARKQTQEQIEQTKSELVALRKELLPLSMAPCDILNQAKFCKMIQNLTQQCNTDDSIQIRAASYQQLSSFSPSVRATGSLSVRHSKSSITRVQQKASVSAQLVGDVALPDGSKCAPGTPFTKVWQVKNNGFAPWPSGMDLVQISGDDLQLMFDDVPAAPAGECVELTARGITANSPGNYVSHVRLRLPDTTPVGPRLWVDLNVT